jgi:hypothetical protein
LGERWFVIDMVWSIDGLEWRWFGIEMLRSEHGWHGDSLDWRWFGIGMVW